MVEKPPISDGFLWVYNDTMMKRWKPTTTALKDFEDRLQSMVEGRLARLFDGGIRPHTIATRLAQALEANLIEEGNVAIAPDQFVVVLNDEMLQRLLLEREAIAQELAQHLLGLVYETHLHIKQSPKVTLVGDKTLPLRDVRVRAEHSEIVRESTQALVAIDDNTPIPHIHDAYLILEDGKHVALKRTIVNIGRNSDNHVVIKNQAVSRHHCQLRLRFGRYVLYDLQSKSGTFVNGYRVQEHILASGDVITFSGVQIIYIEYEDDDHETLSDTQADQTQTDHDPHDLSEE